MPSPSPSHTTTTKNDPTPPAERSRRRNRRAVEMDQHPNEALLSAQQRQQLSEIRAFFQDKAIVTFGGTYTAESRHPHRERFHDDREQELRRSQQPACVEQRLDNHPEAIAEMNQVIALSMARYPGGDSERVASDLRKEYMAWFDTEKAKHDAQADENRKVLAQQVARMMNPYDPNWPRRTCAAVAPEPQREHEREPEYSSFVRFNEDAMAVTEDLTTTVKFFAVSALIQAASRADREQDAVTTRHKPQRESRRQHLSTNSNASGNGNGSSSNRRTTRADASAKRSSSSSKRKLQSDDAYPLQHRRATKFARKSSSSAAAAAAAPFRNGLHDDAWERDASLSPNSRNSEGRRSHTDDEWHLIQRRPSTKSDKSDVFSTRLRSSKSHDQSIVPDHVNSWDAVHTSTLKRARRDRGDHHPRHGRRSPSEMSHATNSSYSTYDSNDRHQMYARTTNSGVTITSKTAIITLKKCHHCKQMKTDHVKCSYLQPTGKSCYKWFCFICLAEVYKMNTSKIIKSEWHCPCCLGNCLAAPCVKSREREKKRNMKLKDSGARPRSRRSVSLRSSNLDFV